MLLLRFSLALELGESTFVRLIRRGAPKSGGKERRTSLAEGEGKVIMARLGVLLVILLLVMSVAEGKRRKDNCLSRPERKQRKQIVRSLTCRDPHMSLVQIDVPDGYDWVHPSAVKINRCDGLMCVSPKHQCIGQQKKDYTLKVNAYKYDPVNGEMHICTNATLEEHLTCGCGCILSHEICQADNKLFNEDQCKCYCDPLMERKCVELKPAGLKMWDPELCKCVCTITPTSRANCGTNMVWIEEACRCIALSALGLEDN